MDRIKDHDYYIWGLKTSFSIAAGWTWKMLSCSSRLTCLFMEPKQLIPELTVNQILVYIFDKTAYLKWIQPRASNCTVSNPPSRSNLFFRLVLVGWQSLVLAQQIRLSNWTGKLAWLREMTVDYLTIFLPTRYVQYDINQVISSLITKTDAPGGLKRGSLFT